VVLAWLAASDRLREVVLVVLAVCQQVIGEHKILGAFLFVALAALSALLAFVSTAVLVPVATYTWGEPLAMLLLWVGWWLGGLCAYSIGRYLGQPVVAWLTKRSASLQLERYMAHRSSFAIVLLFQLALPSEIPGYVLGTLRYPLPRYLLSLALAELPYALLTVHLGASFVAGKSAFVMQIGLLLVMLSVAAMIVLRRKLAE
jgi:uncharacterized membrane protein YdjX (TVP38/TMEM64 family)